MYKALEVEQNPELAEAWAGARGRLEAGDRDVPSLVMALWPVPSPSAPAREATQEAGVAGACWQGEVYLDGSALEP
eukprot:864815-Lingulodinium_polyedra.AAC.1